MRTVYICSPYRAADSAQLDRNIDYAQALTKQAIEAGLAPITPHLYMTQCLNEDKPEERAAGMAAGYILAQATAASSHTERLTSMQRNILQVDKEKSPLRYGNTLEG